jgi:hypothetical protein
VLVICPPPVVEMAAWGDVFQGAAHVAEQLPEQYRRIARESGVDFLDAGTIIAPSSQDGVHLEADAHFALAQAVAAMVRRLV